MDLERVLRRWDEQLLSRLAPGDDPVEPVRVTGSVLRTPATESTIVAAEARLGTPLPPSYRAFLAVSDGAYADPEVGAITTRTIGYTRSREPGLGLLPVAEIAPLAAMDPVLYRVWAEEARPGGPSIRRDGDEVTDYGGLARGAVLIGSAYEGATVLVRATRAVEWQLWVFRKEGAIAYRSFGSWLRFVTRTVPAAELPALLARYDAGDTATFHDIMRVRDPVAVPVLAAAVERGQPSAEAAVAVLGTIGTAAAALAVEPALDDPQLGFRAEAALGQMRDPVAGDVLARHGCHGELGKRRDPRAGSLAVAALTPPHFKGANSLRLLGDPAYLPELREAAERADSPAARYAIAIARYELGDDAAAADLAAIAADPAHPNHRNAQAVLRVR